MSRRLEMESQRVSDRAENGDPLWPPQFALAIAIGLNLALTEKLTIGPSWLLPALEAVALVGLIIDGRGQRADVHRPRQRRIALSIIAFISLANAVSLALLVHYLVKGGHANGHRLIESGTVLWLTNVLLFSVWYWEMDGGGPARRHRHPDAMRDFQFPQMENPQLAPRRWRPGFADYLYIAVTNATAFSPTDAMPLTQSAKGVMALQSLTALVTVALVVARAVNILA